MSFQESGRAAPEHHDSVDIEGSVRRELTKADSRNFSRSVSFNVRAEEFFFEKVS